MNRILITGGAGFIGSHTCLLFLQRGYKILVLDSFINSSITSIERVKKIVEKEKKGKNIEIIQGDLRDNGFLKNVFAAYHNENERIDAVIHFAGLKSVNESLINPIKYWEFNVMGTLNLLKVMNENNCNNLVFSSSATVYGISNNEKLTENCIIKPINTYGKTKASVEAILEDLFYSENEKWRIANLRYFNPIGAHQSGLIGENPTGIPNNIFPLITQVAIGNIKKLKIFGNDWPTKDGTGIRDYIHVMDLAEGHLLALNYILENKHQVLNLNLGTGVSTSVLELVNTFQEVNDVEVPYEISQRRKGDYPYVVADINYAKKLFNWKPKFDLRKMCLDGWNWQKLNPNGYDN